MAKKPEIIKHEGWGMDILTPKAKTKTASELGYYIRDVKVKTSYGYRTVKQKVTYRRKPKPTQTRTVGGRTRRIYAGEAKKQLEEFARAKPKSGAVEDWSGYVDGNFYIEAFNLQSGVVGYAEHYADSDTLERIRQMDAEVLQHIYNAGSIVFEVYFQYTNVGYSEEYDAWMADDEAGMRDQFQFLIEKYNEYAEKHGLASV